MKYSINLSKKIVSFGSALTGGWHRFLSALLISSLGHAVLVGIPLLQKDQLGQHGGSLQPKTTKRAFTLTTSPALLVSTSPEKAQKKGVKANEIGWNARAKNATSHELKIKPRAQVAAEFKTEKEKPENHSASPALPSPDSSAEQMLIAIHSQITRFLRYPALLQKKAMQGQVRVRMVLSREGLVQEQSVLSSSGYPELDRLALDAIREAEPFSVSLEQGISLIVPIEFQIPESSH